MELEAGFAPARKVRTGSNVTNDPYWERKLQELEAQDGTRKAQDSRSSNEADTSQSSNATYGLRKDGELDRRFTRGIPCADKAHWLKHPRRGIRKSDGGADERYFTGSMRKFAQDESRLRREYEKSVCTCSTIVPILAFGFCFEKALCKILDQYAYIFDL